MSLAILNAAEFKDQVETNAGLTLVDFYADWCGPCKMIAPVLEQLADDYAGKVNIVKLDADAHPEVLQKYGVRGLPTLMIFENGLPKATAVGAQPASALKSFIEHNVA
ncbi:thioredoxin [Reinekea sp. G2M2-21]|uniref:thioredoxin n=1 Tax=Reinekea sp. G2M2-21 TaxID=2788942 RepID=UPI0018AA8E64|nr:thioredoxin [Reinekea sp. G2M2-21]